MLRQLYRLDEASVDPTLLKRTAVQRTVQLTKNPE